MLRSRYDREVRKAPGMAPECESKKKRKSTLGKHYKKWPIIIKQLFVGAILLTMIYRVSFPSTQSPSSNLPSGAGDAKASSSLRSKSKRAPIVKKPDPPAEDKAEPTIKDFCGKCKYSDQKFSCDDRVNWTVNKKGGTVEDAKKGSLNFCVNANNCNDELDGDGLMPCGIEEWRKKQPTIKDFCGRCKYRDQRFSCDNRVEWAINKYGVTTEDAKKSNLKFCVNAKNCNDKLDADGLMPCQEL